MKHCSSCKNQINKGDIFCEKCGAKVIYSPTILTTPTLIKSEIGLVSDKQKNAFYEVVALISISLFLALIILAIGYFLSYQGNNPNALYVSVALVLILITGCCRWLIRLERRFK